VITIKFLKKRLAFLEKDEYNGFVAETSGQKIAGYAAY
jgi:hypothetical protein